MSILDSDKAMVATALGAVVAVILIAFGLIPWVLA
jgi:hypothetical protein